MLTFICPHCDHPLKINAEHVGLRGKCNKCGGRIALIGRADAQRPQMASRIAEISEADERPATPRQQAAAQRLGATPAEVAQLTRGEAGALFEQLRHTRDEMLPPTAPQLEYLRRLGLPQAQLQAVATKAEATQLIEQWLPPPTPSQRSYLERLGATLEEIAALRTKSEAADLIQRFLSGT